MWQQVDRVEKTVIAGGLAEECPTEPQERIEIEEETSRLEVPGGWLYKVVRFADDTPSVALCFVPDPEVELQRVLEADQIALEDEAAAGRGRA
jgi:hypothetical protein